MFRFAGLSAAWSRRNSAHCVSHGVGGHMLVHKHEPIAWRSVSVRGIVRELIEDRLGILGVGGDGLAGLGDTLRSQRSGHRNRHLRGHFARCEDVHQIVIRGVSVLVSQHDHELVADSERIKRHVRSEVSIGKEVGGRRQALVKALDIELLPLDEELARRSGPVDLTQLIFVWLVHEADQPSDDVAWVALFQALDRAPADYSVGTKNRQRGQPVRCRRPVDLAQHLHGGDLLPLAAPCEDRPDHGHRPRVGHLGQPAFGLCSLRGILAPEPIAQFFQLWLPVLVGQLLVCGFLFRGGGLFGLDAAVALLLVSQMFPGGFTRGVEPGHRRCSEPGLAP